MLGIFTCAGGGNTPFAHKAPLRQQGCVCVCVCVCVCLRARAFV